MRCKQKSTYARVNSLNMKRTIPQNAVHKKIHFTITAIFELTNLVDMTNVAFFDFYRLHRLFCYLILISLFYAGLMLITVFITEMVILHKYVIVIIIIIIIIIKNYFYYYYYYYYYYARQRYLLASNTAFVCYIKNCTQMRQRF